MLWLALMTGSADTASDAPLPRFAPKEPIEAAQSFAIREGFEMQLLASEPLVTDPVAMEYDEAGRAWVAEMRDYPYTDKNADKPFTEKTTDLPLGRIRILEDTNDDGVFDKSTIFADNLSWPTGLALWKGGVFVVATPDMWYLKDTDGDGTADIRNRVLTGFRKFNVQAVINNLKWGLDHRLYGAGSSNGGQIVSPDHPGTAPLTMATGDFRFQPDDVHQSFELLSGGARFGNSFDDWGHRFICNIRNPIQQIVLPRTALARNSWVPFRSAVHDVALSGDTVPVWRKSQPEPWRVLNARRLASDPSVASPKSESVAAGYMTSASGVTIYRGDAYPAELYGTVFLAEVAGNLIHHQQLTKNGVAFSSERTSDGAEFLASADNWFRPVNFVNAPDGTLHVMDMYRETIEHPWSIPDDIKAKLDLESGRDRGRIWRLAPKGFKPPKGRTLEKATTSDLVSALTASSSWSRDTAHRLLFERQDPEAVPLLRQLLRKSSPSVGSTSNAWSTVADPQAAGRLNALWSLEGLNALTTDDLKISLADPHPGIRANAITLSESRLTQNPELYQAVFSLAFDVDPEVRFQLALTAGSLPVTAENQESVAKALAVIGLRDSADQFTRAAILTSASEIPISILRRIFPGLNEKSPEDVERLLSGGLDQLLHDLTLIAGARGDLAEQNSLYEAVMSINEGTLQQQIVPTLALGFARGLKRSNKAVQSVLMESQHPGAARLMKTFSDVSSIDTFSERIAAGGSSASDATELLAFADYETVKNLLTPLLQSGQPANTQAVAVRVMAGHQTDEVAEMFVSVYRSLRAPGRMEAMEALLSRPQWHDILLTAAEAGTIPVFDIPHLRRNLLLRSRDEQIKARAVKLFSATLTARREVVDRYRDQIPSQQAAKERGEVIYKRECQICHRVGTAGQDLGPNLATIRHRAPDEVLLHILDPNREVAPNYIAQVVVTEEGQLLTGLVTEETPHQITLKLSTGTETQIPRTKIAEISSTGQSLMPVGFEQKINVSEMADLLEFLLR